MEASTMVKQEHAESRIQVQLLLDALKRAWRDSRWHAFKRAIKGLTDEETRWHPPAYKGFAWSSGSIMDILFHVGGDCLIQIDYAFRNGQLTWEELQQRFNDAGGNLDAALKLLEEGYRTVHDALSSLTDADLDRECTAYSGTMRLRDLFLMLIEHFIYHAGQIVYIRCMQSGIS